MSVAPLGVSRKVMWFGKESVLFEVITSLVGRHFPFVGRSAWAKGFSCCTGFVKVTLWTITKVTLFYFLFCSGVVLNSLMGILGRV